MTEPTDGHNAISRHIVDCALTVHRNLGPGLLESVYEECLAWEMASRNLDFLRQPALPILYRNTRMQGTFRLAFLVENCVVIELKAVENLSPIHEAQLLTYLKLSGIQLGLLINFNVALIRNGIKRMVLSA